MAKKGEEIPRELTYTVDRIDIGYLEETYLVDFYDRIKEIIDQIKVAGGNPSRAKLSLEFFGYSNNADEILIKAVRPETPEEVKVRIEKRKKRDAATRKERDKKREARRKQYEKLKKEFEG